MNVLLSSLVLTFIILKGTKRLMFYLNIYFLSLFKSFLYGPSGTIDKKNGILLVVYIVY